MVTIYWREEDDSTLHYVSSTADVQAARDYCVKKSSEFSARVYCLFRAQNGNESIMSQYQVGQAFVKEPNEERH